MVIAITFFVITSGGGVQGVKNAYNQTCPYLQQKNLQSNVYRAPIAIKYYLICLIILFLFIIYICYFLFKETGLLNCIS